MLRVNPNPVRYRGLFFEMKIIAVNKHHHHEAQLTRLTPTFLSLSFFFYLPLSAFLNWQFRHDDWAQISLCNTVTSLDCGRFFVQRPSQMHLEHRSKVAAFTRARPFPSLSALHFNGLLLSFRVRTEGAVVRLRVQTEKETLLLALNIQRAQRRDCYD